MSKPINAVMELGGKIQTRFDSWKNALTGLGNALRDKTLSTFLVGSSRLSDDQTECLYHDNDMAARIVEALPEDALRRGYKVTVDGDEESDIPKQAEDYEENLDFRKQFKQAAIWGRCYGGAVLYLGINDGRPEDQPVNEESIRSIDFVTLLTKREIEPWQYYLDPLKDKKFGKPKTYRIIQVPVAGHTVDQVKAQELANVEIHESRLLRFDGARTSARRAQHNSGWNESVLQKVHEVLRNFDIGWHAATILIQEASQGVFALEGLVDMVQGGDKETLNTRMELVDMSRSVARAILLDADKESFQRVNYNFAGLPDTLRVFMMRLSGAARMPLTKLMGQSPQGLNSSGEVETRNWYDEVETYREEELHGPLVRWHRLMFAAQDFPGDAPEAGWAVVFSKLWQLTDKEQAELEKTVAERDKIYIDAQVVLPEEIAIARFKPGGFDMETQIDTTARESMLKAEIELAKKNAGKDPMEMMPDANNPGGTAPTQGTQPSGGTQGSE